MFADILVAKDWKGPNDSRVSWWNNPNLPPKEAIKRIKQQTRTTRKITFVIASRLSPVLGVFVFLTTGIKNPKCRGKSTTDRKRSSMLIFPEHYFFLGIGLALKQVAICMDDDLIRVAHTTDHRLTDCYLS